MCVRVVNVYVVRCNSKKKSKFEKTNQTMAIIQGDNMYTPYIRTLEKDDSIYAVYVTLARYERFAAHACLYVLMMVK